MTEVIPGVIVLLGLLYASVQDLKNRQIKVKVYVYTLVPAVLLAALLSEPVTAGRMLVQGGIFFGIGLIFRLVTMFGMGDILALTLAGSQFPDALGFRVAAYLTLPMYAWMKAYSFFMNTKRVPAVPGILLGYAFLFFVFTVGNKPI